MISSGRDIPVRKIQLDHVKLWLREADIHLDVGLWYGCHSYLISQDQQSLYWKKLDDVGRELFHVTKDYINKLSDYDLIQVRSSMEKIRFSISIIMSQYRCNCNL